MYFSISVFYLSVCISDIFLHPVLFFMSAGTKIIMNLLKIEK